MTEKTLTKRKIVLKPKNYMCFLILGVLLVLFAVLYYTGNMKRSSARLLHQIAYSIILAVSLNLVVGFLGELSLGHAGFMYVGAIIGCYAGSLLGKFIPVPLVTLILSLIVGGAVAIHRRMIQTRHRRQTAILRRHVRTREHRGGSPAQGRGNAAHTRHARSDSQGRAQA